MKSDAEKSSEKSYAEIVPVVVTLAVLTEETNLVP